MVVKSEIGAGRRPIYNKNFAHYNLIKDLNRQKSQEFTINGDINDIIMEQSQAKTERV